LGISDVETQDDLDALFSSDEFAEAATYTPVGGEDVSCQVQLLRGAAQVLDEFGGVIENKDLVEFRRDQVTNPRTDASLVIGAATFLVGKVVSLDAHVIRVEVREI